MKNLSHENMKIGVAAAILVVIGISAVSLTVARKSRHTDSPAATSTSSPVVKYQCVAGPDEQCASDIWYADYVRMKALQQKYTAPQDQLDLITGMAARLGQSVPPGYYWDDAKSRFVKQKLPTPPVQAQAPVQAPPVRRK